MTPFKNKLQLLQRLATGCACLVLYSLTCLQRPPTESIQVWNDSDTQTFSLELEDASTLCVTNYYGGAIIYGHNSSSIRIELRRYVESTDRARLSSMLNNIRFISQIYNDTLFVLIRAPISAGYSVYSSSMNIFIPYDLPLRVKGAKSTVIVSELDSLVTLRNVAGPIQIDQHRGSIDVLSEEPIQIALASLEGNQWITARSDSQDVFFKFPVNSNATFTAQSFFFPIDLINVELETSRTPLYRVDGVIGNGEARVDISTHRGTITIMAE